MPKILEMKEVAGEFWVKVDIGSYINKNQAISLYTDNEIKNLLFQERLAFKEMLHQFLQEKLR